jgi:hypothetical protein
MSNKLQNIKAVNELLAGTHKTQTRQSVYTGVTKKEISDNDIIERFDNGDPKIWIETSPNGTKTRVTQHDGFKSREPENSVLKSIQDALAVPEKCPKCGKKMRDHEQRLNFKFWFKRKSCFECVLKEERRIKAKGEVAWREYQNKIMSANAESWFKDTDKEVEILKQTMKETVWGNADGEFGEVDISAQVDRIETDYKKLKQNIRNQFAETENGKE